MARPQGASLELSSSPSRRQGEEMITRAGPIAVTFAGVIGRGELVGLAVAPRLVWRRGGLEANRQALLCGGGRGGCSP